MNLNPFRKTIAAVIGAALTWGTVVTQSAPAAPTSAEWIAGGILLATAVGIYKVTNEPS